MDYKSLMFNPTSGTTQGGGSQADAGAYKSGSYYQNRTAYPGGGVQAETYPFNFVRPVSFSGQPFNFSVPDVASLAAQYQTSLDPRFNALRDSRTSQLRADFDFLREKEFQRLNQRGAIGSGVENQQMGRFNDEFSRQLSEIDKELIAGQQKEAFDLASREAELRFRVQSAAAENRLNTEIAKAETALKSGQLTLAERELYIKRLRDLLAAQDAFRQRQIEYIGTEQQVPDSGGGGFSVGDIFSSAAGIASAGTSIYDSLRSGGTSDAYTHLNTANKTFNFGNYY